MKTLLMLFSFCVFQSVQAQKLFPEKDGKIVYEEIIELPGVKKSTLYSNAKKWFIDAFKDSKEMILTDDKEGGQIIGKGSSMYSEMFLLSTFRNRIGFTIQFDIKDEKYRYRIYGITHVNEVIDGNLTYYKPESIDNWNEGIRKGKKSIEKSSKKIQEIMDALIVDIKKTMLEKSANNDF